MKILPYGDVYWENVRLHEENGRLLSMLADLAMKNGGQVTANAALDRSKLEISVTEQQIRLNEFTIQVRRIETIEGTVLPNGQKEIAR